MKIAVYHNLHSGGAKRTLCAIVQRLGKRHPLDVYDLSCSDHEFCDLAESAQNTYTYPFDPLPQLRRPFGRLNYGARLADLYRLETVQKRIALDIDQRGYDAVYVHPCQFTQTPSLMCYLKTPSLYHSRESLRAAYEPSIPRPYKKRKTLSSILDTFDLLSQSYHRTHARIDRTSVQQATLIVTNSYFTRETLYRIYGVNARVCYHGIDTAMFRRLNVPRQRGVVSVGALTPNKGFDFIISSLALAPAEIRPPLIIVSNYQEPNEKMYLEDLARRSQVPVQFLKLVGDDVLVKTYNQAQLVAYAPVLEPFGLVPLEAMACGTPIVAVCEGGVRESVAHERTGLLVDRDSAQFAAAVQRLVCDPALAEKLGHNGREYVEQNWTWDNAVSKLEEHLALCASMKKPT